MNRLRWAPSAIVGAIILGASVTPCAPAAPGQAHAKSKTLSQSLTGQAKADFEAAKLLATDGDFAGALIKFQSAYDASKDPRLLWNVAFCEKNLRHYSKVIATLKRYVDEGRDVLSANDKKDAQDLVSALEPFTTHATFVVSEDGAEISVDDEVVGTSPLADPVVLDIGERHLRVAKSGFQPFEKSLPVGGSASVTVKVDLVKEVHEGKLVVEAAPGAAIFLDDQPIGTGKVEQTIPSGGHQLRVTAAGMRPYQTEIVVQDRETRSLNVVLEREAVSTEKPMLRVAVGCGDTEPKGPEDGLVVYLDGPEVLPPGPVKRRWNAELGKNVVERVEYPITPGPHSLRIASTGCRSLDTTIQVDSVKGADVTGALESARFVLFRGPQGSPGWFRAGLGLWLGGADQITNHVPEQYSSKGLTTTGIVAEVGAVSRWFGVWLDYSYASGSITRRSFDTNYLLPESAAANWERFAVRLGLRIPFNVVSLGFGSSLAVEEVNLDRVRTGEVRPGFGAYAELDIQLLCDWGLFAEPFIEKPAGDQGPYYAFQLGAFWGPSPECHKERETAFGLRTAR